MGHARLHLVDVLYSVHQKKATSTLPPSTMGKNSSLAILLKQPWPKGGAQFETQPHLAGLWEGQGGWAMLSSCALWELMNKAVLHGSAVLVLSVMVKICPCVSHTQLVNFP